MGWWSDVLGKLRSPDDASAPADSTVPDKVMPPPGKGMWLSRLRPVSRRDRQIAWLQAGYSEMLDLMRGIRQHLDRQEDVHQKMVAALEHLPASMDHLKSVGKAAEQQVEMLAVLRHQIESSTAHDQQLVESINRLNQTLGVMDETSRTSARTFVEFVERSKETERLLHRSVDRSERRVFFVAGVFLVIVILIAGSVVYFGSGRRWPLLPPVAPAAQPAVSAGEAPPAEPGAAGEETSAVAPGGTEGFTEPAPAGRRRGFWSRLFHRGGVEREEP